MSRLIDANALIAEMHNIILEDGEDRRIIYEVIERQPTIDQVKHGRWIKNERKSKFHIEPVYICSCCREQEAWGQMELSNYCQNCGAKMDEGGDAK